MKLVASQKVSKELLEELVHSKELAIVVFPQTEESDSFGCNLPNSFWLGYSNNNPITVIGTHGNEQYDKVWMQKHGTEELLQIYIPTSVRGRVLGLGEKREYENIFFQNDKIKDVSPTDTPIIALTRICADLYAPMPNLEPVDLIIAPSYAIDSLGDVQKEFLLENCKPVLKDSTKFIIANNNGPVLTGVYNSKLEKISQNKGFCETLDI